MLQQASRQSATSTPPPPPITLNPPSQQADTSAPSAQLNPSLHHLPSVSRTLLHTLRPPRSSSLQGTSSSGQRPSSPSPAPGSATTYAPHRDHSRAPPVSLKQRPSTPSSQIEKANFASLSPREGSRARNRWSTSTISSTSSRTSPFAARRTGGSPNRRASFEVSGVRGSPPLVRQSSQRLLQGRLPPLGANHNTPVAVETGQLGAPGVPQPALGYHGANHPRGASPGPFMSKTLPETRMPYDQGREAHPNRGHSRERSGKGSQDSGKRGQKPPSQKAMLSKALQKANAAVQLDNAQNLEGARGAYADACQLLQHVLQRTTTDEDRRKLEVIQQTYTSRIAELDQMGPWQQDTTKALPARPESEEYMRDIYAYYAEFSGAMPKTNPTHRASLMGESSTSHGRQAKVSSPTQRPVSGSPQDIVSERRPSHPSDSSLPPSSFPVRSSSGRRPREDPSRLAPAPLSSARSISPVRLRSDDVYDAHDMRGMGHDAQSPTSEGNPGRFGRRISQDAGSASWLDPIDESGGSVMNSPHSRRSSMGFHRRHNRMTSGNTEAEFDSALDAAIEAAYNDNFEYGGRSHYGSLESNRDSIMGAYGAVEPGRESERSRKRDSHYGMRSMQMGRRDSIQEEHDEQGGFYEDDSSDEERILEEITRDFAIEDFTMGQQLRPVKEDWMSSALETDSRTDIHPLLPMPGPSVLPEQLPAPDLSQAPILSLPQPPLAGHNRQSSEARSLHLMIETTNLGAAKPIAMMALKRQSSVSTTGRSEVASIAESVRAASIEERSTSSSSLVAATTEGSALPELGMMSKRATGSDDGSLHAPASPPFSKLRKKFSSSSLRSVKGRNMSLSNLEEVVDKSPTLPTSQQQPLSKPPVPALPVALAHTLMASYRDHVNVSIAGGLHLFDQFHQGNEPGSPSDAVSNAPVPLEPCPADLCLRPFWLMRCLFQTLVHPRGGYLSSKLFVPRDVWRTRGVKLKNLEEKIAQCDFLTAALLKLGKANPLDADALLVEMQEFESVVEVAQQVLTRKLGNDVGAQHSGYAPKEGSGAADGDGGSQVPRSGSVSGKQSSFSWRRLRSKPSTIGLGGSSSSSRTGTDGMKENSNVPMTAKPTSRPAKRDLSQAQFSGPNATYMASLAHLFDAAQTLDEIARQVEDPGLKHADKTQVGLELGTRHAAEFFGFYICRFVLADLSLLLDKFLKRGSEWVLT
ncbi:hypothetical protein ESCO_005729 [Escovopsis weberi]|uniref:MIT domain-containing protein n=1 Tax=Escovopsis weberi TaxID=150374 RepID=A0A0M8N4Z1_ESCWE|nr:hypothetical protein ESCO_005729 [Escovopsis weberi]